MSNDKERPVFPRVKPGTPNFGSEVAKEFGYKGERKVISSSEGTTKDDLISVESQMSGVPVYTRKKTNKGDKSR